MNNPIKNYWQIRLADLKSTLEENNFEVFLAQNTAEAKTLALEKIIPAINPKSISFKTKDGKIERISKQAEFQTHRGTRETETPLFYRKIVLQIFLTDLSVV